MYGLIGKKLSHSFSADYFNAKFKKEGIENKYSLFPLSSISEFPQFLDQHRDIEGLNVTIPYKEEIIPYLDFISDEAKQIGAVNVIKVVKENGQRRLEGYNSDCMGFRDSLVPLLRNDVSHALILGTGGASKSVAYVLKNLGIDFTFVSRSPAPGRLTYKDLDKQIIENNLLIINTTPLGTYPEIDNCPPIPYQHVTDRHIFYDLVYNPATTLFLKQAREQGATIKNGLEMLELQALGSWDIWTGRDE